MKATPAMNPLPSPAPLCVTRDEFAVLLHVSVRTVDRMIAAGEIQVRRVRGKVVRILRSDAERYLAGENTSSGLRQPSPGASRHPLPSDGRGTSPQSGEGKKNLKTNNQTGAFAPETATKQNSK